MAGHVKRDIRHEITGQNRQPMGSACPLNYVRPYISRHRRRGGVRNIKRPIFKIQGPPPKNDSPKMPPLRGFWVLWGAVLQIGRAYGAGRPRSVVPTDTVELPILELPPARPQPNAPNQFLIFAYFHCERLPAANMSISRTDPFTETTGFQTTERRKGGDA